MTRSTVRIRFLRGAAIALTAAGVVLLARGLVVAHGGDPRLIHACVKKKGEVRIIDGTGECPKGEEPTDWPGVSMGPVEILSQTSPASSDNKTLKIECPAGKVAIGGGARILGELSNTALVANGPDGPLGAPNAWLAVAQELGAGNAKDWQLRVDVTCSAMLPK